MGGYQFSTEPPFHYKRIAISLDTREKEIPDHPELHYTVAFSAKYNVLLAKPSPGKVQILNPETGSVIQEIGLSFLGSVGYLGMRKDDQVVIAHTDNSKTIVAVLGAGNPFFQVDRTFYSKNVCHLYNVGSISLIYYSAYTKYLICYFDCINCPIYLNGDYIAN